MTEISKTDRLSFTAEWYDPESTLRKKFILFYFLADNTLELFDTKTKKLFLKRTHCEGVNFEHIYVGNTIIVFARQISINGYADDATRKRLEHAMQKTFALIKPDALSNKGKILQIISNNDFKIARLKMANMTKEQVLELYAEHKGEAFLPFVLDLLTSAPVIAIEMMAKNGIEKFIQLVGPTDSAVAKTDAPNSIRAMFGKDLTSNAVHAAKTAKHVERECELFFLPHLRRPLTTPKASARFENCTCCVVKPHAFQEGKLGEIVSMIEENNYKVTGMELFYMDQTNAEEFLEIYKNVVPEYKMMVEQLISGPCVALEVSGEDNQTPVKFRELVGPTDPDIARRLRPHTIRARFGKNKVENAIHVTDLPEDALLEVEYFFKLLTC